MAKATKAAKPAKNKAAVKATAKEAVMEDRPGISKTPQPSDVDPSMGIPKSSLTSAVTSDLPGAAQEDKPAQDKAYDELDPITKSGLGLIRVDGSGFEYVGSRSKDAETPGGIKVTGENSTFRPLATIPFSNSIRVQDPASGEFYFPPDGCTSWEGCELNGSYLIEKKKTAKA